MGMTSLIRLIRLTRSIGMTIPALHAHEGDLLGMSPARTFSRSQARRRANRHRADGRSTDQRVRTGGDHAAFIQTGNPMTSRNTEFDLVFAFGSPTGEKKWATMTIS
jgi:hypothetical protein